MAAPNSVGGGGRRRGSVVAIPSIIRYDVDLIETLRIQSKGWGISPKLNPMSLATSQALNCPFCIADPSRVFLESELVLGLWDGFPVAPGHALLIPRRHVTDWFQATADEQAALTTAIGRVRTVIEERATREGRPMPDGYNIGINAGAAAGQTVFHLHVHVIPRYAGDVADARGGVRHVIPSKANYLVRDDPGEYGRPGYVDEVRLTTGPDAPLLGRLLADIDRSLRVDIAVAFVMPSGVNLLFEHLRDVLERNGQLRLLTGDYLGVTDPQALMRLLDLPHEPQLRVFETGGSILANPFFTE